MNIEDAIEEKGYSEHAAKIKIQKKVTERALADVWSDCWIWNGPCGEDVGNYRQPQLKMFGRTWYVSHLIAFAWHGEKNLHGMSCYRTCGDYACVNPEHIKVGTNSEAQKHRVARGGTAKGIHNGRAKLNDDDVRDIRKLLDSGKLSKKEIAREYEVDPKLITKIERREIWKHVE